VGRKGVISSFKLFLPIFEEVLALARHQLGQVLALCWAQPWQLAVPAPGKKTCKLLYKTVQKSTCIERPLPVLVIRICRIRTFLGLPDPDPIVRSTDPDMKKSLKKGVGSGSISQRY
jgi:hypothetical protein